VERAGRLDQLLGELGREPSSVKRTLMGQVPIGRDEAHLASRYSAETIARQRDRGSLIGTPSELVEQLGRYAEAGVEGVQIQLWNQDDIEGLELFASEVIPQLA
jgi:alkanesulfonate monooxygenase SsuD/methylene tetrahydromethanopterin reductase-like flavin-dependent oxidoreductase (luciferase family)